MTRVPLAEVAAEVEEHEAAMAEALFDSWDDLYIEPFDEPEIEYPSRPRSDYEDDEDSYQPHILDAVDHERSNACGHLVVRLLSRKGNVYVRTRHSCRETRRHWVELSR